jgi:hypothetical protein
VSKRVLTTCKTHCPCERMPSSGNNNNTSVDTSIILWISLFGYFLVFNASWQPDANGQYKLKNIYIFKNFWNLTEMLENLDTSILDEHLKVEANIRQIYFQKLQITTPKWSLTFLSNCHLKVDANVQTWNLPHQFPYTQNSYVYSSTVFYLLSSSLSLSIYIYISIIKQIIKMTK